MSIGARLKQLRTENRLSQERLGDYCGVTKGMVSQWEADIVTPPTDRLVELNKHIQFSFDWLLSGKQDIAMAIEQRLSVRQKEAWYRVGRALIEPEDDTKSHSK